MTYNDGYDDDEDDGRVTIFIVVMVLGFAMLVALCVLGATWP
jgi:hypothetical protein